MCKVSVVIPIYQAEAHIQSCLDSVRWQTLKDIEILCIVHDSTDNSFKILQENAKLDHRIHIVSLENIGVSACRNRGIAMSKGKFIYFMDSDDTLKRHALKYLYKKACKQQSDIVTFGAKVISENEVPEWVRTGTTPNRRFYREFSSELLFRQRGAKPFVWNKLYRRNFLIKNKLYFPEDITDGEDMYFQFITLSKAQNCLFVPKRLYYYHFLNENCAMQLSIGNISYRVSEHQKIAHGIFRDLDNETLQQIQIPLAKWYIDFLSEDIKKLPETQKRKEIIHMNQELGKIHVHMNVEEYMKNKDRVVPKNIIQAFFLYWKKNGTHITYDHLVERIARLLKNKNFFHHSERKI